MTYTSELAAQALGVEVGQIAKSLVFKAGDKLIMVIASGDQRVDTKKLATQLGISAAKVKFANVETVLRETGFTVGGVSPIGLLQPIPIYLDKGLRRYPIVYAAAGKANSVAYNACAAGGNYCRKMAGCSIMW